MEDTTPVAAGEHVLPPLPYGYDALEPVIDARTLKIHHDKHHKKYVDDLNKTELALVDARKRGDFSNIPCLEDALAYNGGGHTLHSVFWTVMTRADSGGAPGVCTQSYIDWYFGGMDAFKGQFVAAANGVQGSGWAILGYNAAFSRLELLQCEKHQNLTQWGFIPILVLDVWEHAYYLQYQNERARYIKEWWRLVNWPVVESRFFAAVNGALPIV